MKLAPHVIAKTLRLLISIGLVYIFLKLALIGTNDGTENSKYLRIASRALQDEELCTEACCEQYLHKDSAEEALRNLPSWVQYILIVVLLGLSACFAGLTLGLMGLDKTGLEIIMDGDDDNAAYARAIYPLRKDGNLLLCSLLLGNTSINALISILLADKAGGLVGFFVSTFSILIFAEILPQAAFSRYSLWVGAHTLPLVRVILVLFYPVTKPIAVILDLVLGQELATVYSNAELTKMLEIHVKENALDKETANTMTGALTFKDTRVKQVMTPLANTLMISVDEKLNFETVAKIFKAGYSRIPVYEISPNNVIGLLLVKDLIFIDPDDEIRVADFIGIFGRSLIVVWPDDKLGDVLRELRTGRSHMALVRDVNNSDPSQDPFYEIKGIITLEDIIEEILGHEIVDETDTFIDGTHSQTVDRAETFEWARLRFLDSKIVDQRLSKEEAMAVTAHLSKNFPDVVTLLTENQLHRLVADTPLTILPTAKQEIGARLPSDLLYEKGVPSDICTLLLSGKVTVQVGADEFRSDAPSWSLLGTKALSDSSYKPDFSAFVSSGPCRCLCITRARYAAAVDASTAERLAQKTQPVLSDVVSMHTGEMPPAESDDKAKLALEALQTVWRGSGGERVTSTDSRPSDVPQGSTGGTVGDLSIGE